MNEETHILLYHQISEIFDHCISIKQVSFGIMCILKQVSFGIICILFYALENILRRSPLASPDC